MQPVQIDHNPDLKRLQDEGYTIEIKGTHLIMHYVPYSNNKAEICYGMLVSELSFASPGIISRPASHTIYFAGTQPCNTDKTEITAIKHSNQLASIGGVTVQRMFSNKPAGGYANYYDKFTRYCEIISAPARALDAQVTAKTFRVIGNTVAASPFQYLDTNSSRAEVNQIAIKFQRLKIAIIGLGGTGAYILDLLAKTPVAEIHSFDGDDFLQHNAFRSPGAASGETLGRRLKKTQYYYEIYAQMHKGLVAHDYYLVAENFSELDQMSFVFIAIDNGAARKAIIQYLLKKGIAFIDVGIGVEKVDDVLIGAVRVTTSANGQSGHLVDRVPMENDERNEYHSNIQIADLNMLNATLAVIKWKKLVTFYQDLEKEFNSTYTINTAQLTNDDIAAPVC